jgi:hypothetical protein
VRQRGTVLLQHVQRHRVARTIPSTVCGHAGFGQTRWVLGPRFGAGTAAYPPRYGPRRRRNPERPRLDKWRLCPGGHTTGVPRPPSRYRTWERPTDPTPTRPRLAPSAARLGTSGPGARGPYPTRPNRRSVGGGGDRVQRTRPASRSAPNPPPA